MYTIAAKFTLGGPHEKQCNGNLESLEPSQHLLLDTEKPRKYIFIYIAIINFTKLVPSILPRLTP
jgi:hypothetical protein